MDILIHLEMLEINILQILHYFQHPPQDKEILVEIMAQHMLAAVVEAPERQVNLAGPLELGQILQVKVEMDFAQLLLAQIIQ